MLHAVCLLTWKNVAAPSNVNCNHIDDEEAALETIRLGTHDVFKRLGLEKPRDALQVFDESSVFLFT